MCVNEKETLTVIVPARDEACNIAQVITQLRETLTANTIPSQLIVVDDASSDNTGAMARQLASCYPCISVISRTGVPGFGRALRAGLGAATGDLIAIFMGDGSDCAGDLVRCYEKATKGYDCVFGSRFITGSRVIGYPIVKRLLNRIINCSLQLLFWTRHNDLTNGFKLYRNHVIRGCQPYRACDFEISLEMSLGALIRGYRIAKVPISWRGRTSGLTHFRLLQAGRKYIHTVVVMLLARLLRADKLRESAEQTNAGRNQSL